MGLCEENEQIDDDFMLLLNVMAEIQPFLSDVGLMLRHGAVLFIEDYKSCNKVEKKFEDMGAILCNKVGSNKLEVPNYLLGLHIYSRADKEEAVEKFLSEKEFLPVLVTYGVIPDFIKNCMEVVPLYGKRGTLGPEILEEFQFFRYFAHQNPDILQRELRLFLTSEIYQQSEEDSALNLALEATVAVFCCIYRNSHTERETEQRRTQLRRAILNFVNLATEFAEDFEIVDIVKKAVEKYLDETPDIFVCRCDDIGGEETEAIKKSEAILFDEHWYYIPEKILRQACEPMLAAVSFPFMKRKLCEAEILHSNDTANGNFTVKKLITNVFGYTFRERFLKIQRTFFAPMGGLALEERRGTNTQAETRIGLEEGRH